jgi:mycofactocin precursor
LRRDRASDEFVHRPRLPDEQVRVNALDGRADGGRERGGVRSRRADDDLHHCLRRLAVGDIELRARLVVEALVADVADDADDLARRQRSVVLVVEEDVLADLVVEEISIDGMCGVY